MRKLLILFFATSLFVACNNNKKDDRRSDRDRDRERDDYRSKDDDRNRDSKDADYRDDKDSRDTRDTRNNDDDRKTSNDGGGWSRSEENKFVDECVDEALKNVGSRSRATEYCECMLGKLKGMYSSYSEANKELGNAGQEEINRLAADCN